MSTVQLPPHSAKTPSPPTAQRHPTPTQPGPNRRQFLRQATVAVAGGLALPSFVPAGVLAAANRPGANDRVSVAFIGVGRQGGGLFDFLSRMPTAQIVATADVDWPRALQVAGRVEGTVAYQDYRRILDRSDVDAIVTATPEQWRGPICVHACQAGKDLYVEKPMSLTVREGRMIVDAVHRYGRVFQTGSQQRSMEPNRRGCELIRNGRLGTIRRVIAHNYPSPWECGLPAQTAPAGLDWEQWCGPALRLPFHPDIFAPRANPGWLSFRPFSGGEMTGWGSHGFDQVQWALGMDHTGPVEIWTEGGPLRPPTYHQPESRARGDALCQQPKVFFRYPGDIIMELGDGPQGGALFIGEHGTLRIDRAFCRSDPPNWPKNHSPIPPSHCAAAGTMSRTGSTASARAPNRLRTRRSVTAPPPSVTSAISRVTWDADSNGTRSPNSLKAMRKPMAGWTGSGAGATSCHRSAEGIGLFSSIQFQPSLLRTGRSSDNLGRDIHTRVCLFSHPHERSDPGLYHGGSLADLPHHGGVR
jgi:predicted dehydrogenase